MALSDGAAAAAPYVQQLLRDRELQDAIRRARSATRDAYARGRGKSAKEAAQDKKLRLRLRQALGAVEELWSALGQPAPRRHPRWGGKLAALAVAGAGGYLALNADARAIVLNLLGKNDTSSGHPGQ